MAGAGNKNAVVLVSSDGVTFERSKIIRENSGEEMWKAFNIKSDLSLEEGEEVLRKLAGSSK